MAVTESMVPLDRLSKRVASIDWMRGLVMVLMVIDQVRSEVQNSSDLGPSHLSL